LTARVRLSFDEIYSVGEKDMEIGDFYNIIPGRDHVYEMRTTDVRLYGWFPRRRIFIAVCGALKADTKGRKAVEKHRQAVLAARKAMAFPEPDSVRHTINVRTELL
jgi:hypothetical protein